MNDFQKHVAKRHAEGEYEYRGYTIINHGGGRSVHAAIMRAGGAWLVREKIGDGYYQSLATGIAASTLKEAKRRIDERISKKESK